MARPFGQVAGSNPGRLVILVDTSVLLDVFTQDTQWFTWSSRALREWGDREQLAYNPITLAELGVHARSAGELEQRLRKLSRRDFPWAAAWPAARAFGAYLARRKKAELRTPLPDFFIGAHALVENLPLLTRDPKRVKLGFPGLRLISP